MRIESTHTVQRSVAKYMLSDFDSYEVQICQNRYTSRHVSRGFTSNTLINPFKFSRLKLLVYSACQTAVF